jgi:hypothetical protein
MRCSTVRCSIATEMALYSEANDRWFPTLPHVGAAYYSFQKRPVPVGHPVLYVKTNIHISSYLTHFFLEWEMFQTEVIGKIKTHILACIIILKSAVSEIMWKIL